MSDLKIGLQRKFSIIGLLVVLLLIAGLTFYVTSLFTESSVIVDEPEPVIESPDLEEAIPSEIVSTPKKEELLYVLTKGPEEVVIIDTASERIVERVALPAEPDFGFIDPSDGRLYVSHSFDHLVSVVDVQKRIVVRKIELKDAPGDLVVANDLLFVLIPRREELFIIDPLRETIEREMEIEKNPERLLLSPDGKIMFISHSRADSVSFFSPNILAVTDSVRVGTAPFNLAVNPTERYLYMTNEDDGQISILPLKTKKRVRHVGVEVKPSSIAFSPNDLVALVTNEGSNTVSFVSVSQERVLDSVPVGFAPSDVVVSNDGKKAYVANSKDNIISVLDVERKAKIRDILVGDGPVRLFLVEK